jgi:hypothetical protein
LVHSLHAYLPHYRAFDWGSSSAIEMNRLAGDASP